MCGITILRARGRYLCKRIRPGKVIAYDEAKIFDLHPREVRDLHHLADLLGRLALRRDCCVLRGEPVDMDRLRGVRRLLHPDPEAGEIPTLRDVPRSWCALDVDSLPLPDDQDARDLIGCARHVIATLPACLHGAACIVQATASHGIKPGARMRLWYWLDRPMTSPEAKAALRHLKAPVDLSLFSGAQVHYTAAPAFIGMADPLPVRLVMLDGFRHVHLPPPPPPPPPPPIPPLRKGDDDRARAHAVERFAGLINTAKNAGEGQRHRVLFWCACRSAVLVREGWLSEGEATDALLHAIQAAGAEDMRGAAATVRDGIKRGMAS